MIILDTVISESVADGFPNSSHDSEMSHDFSKGR